MALKVQPVGTSWQDANGRKERQPAREKMFIRDQFGLCRDQEQGPYQNSFNYQIVLFFVGEK